jgi:cytoskeletal protein RodZ
MNLNTLISSKKRLLILVISIIIFLILLSGGGVYLLFKMTKSPLSPSQAKQEVSVTKPSQKKPESNKKASSDETKKPTTPSQTSKANLTSQPSSVPSLDSKSTVSTPPPSPKSPIVRGLWVWDPINATDTSMRTTLMDFAVSKGVNRIYLGSQDLITSNQAALTSFCAVAATHGISVEMLFGHSEWTYTANHNEAVSLATQAAQYVASVQGPKPIAIHFDVEPHTLPDFQTDMNGVFSQYISLLQEVKAAKGSQLQLSIDYPLGFDVLSATISGSTRLMTAWVYDIIDRGVMMDYRDTADTPDGLIARVAYSIQYAASVGKTVSIGVETLCGLDPEKVSFCEEGEAVMNEEIAKTQAAYINSSAFGGFSIHHSTSYMNLIP